MSAGVRKALPRMLASVEMFSDVTICTDTDCRTVQVINRWWMFNDGSYALTLHRADDAMVGAEPISDADAGGRHLLEVRTAAMWDLASEQTSCLPVTG